MPQQKIILQIPKHLKPNERKAVAREVLDFIAKRTEQGKAINGKKWSGAAGKYSEAYKKSLDFKNAGKGKLINLNLSSEMLNSMELLSEKAGSLTVGYDGSDKDLNGKVEGNRKGTYGNKKAIPGKARDFLGITKGDLKKITDKYPEKKPEIKQERAEIVEEATKKSEGVILDIDFDLEF